MPTNSSIASQALMNALSSATRAVHAASGDQSPIAKRLKELNERLADSRLQIAVLGQFKRGKSTFVNALLGAAVLPTAVVPLTALPTFIAWREIPQVRVSFANGRPPETSAHDNVLSLKKTLARFVTEEGNPRNALSVARVDLFYPAPILRNGTVLIDTPGVGSTLTHNTAAALAVIPECDASFFILSVDPPITEAEIEYLNRIKPKVSPVFFVVNKIDYLGADDLSEATRFLHDALQRASLINIDDTIFTVSARQALSAKEAADRELLKKSRIATIEDYLAQYLDKAKVATLHKAVVQKAINLVAQTDTDLDFRIQALKIPLDQLVEKSVAFGNSLATLEVQHETLNDLLSGDRRRLVQDLETKIKHLRERAFEALSPVIDESLAGSGGSSDDGLKSTLPGNLEKIFGEASATFAADFARQTDNLLARHRQAIDAAVDDIRRIAAEMFDVQWTPAGDVSTFAVRHDPYWMTEQLQIKLIPDLAPLLDRILPARRAQRRRRARIVAQTQELILRNAENLRWAILRGIDETIRDASVELQQRLDEVVAATKDVIEDALQQRRDQSFTSAEALAHLRELKAGLAGAQAALREAVYSAEAEGA